MFCSILTSAAQALKDWRGLSLARPRGSRYRETIGLAAGTLGAAIVGLVDCAHSCAAHNVRLTHQVRDRPKPDIGAADAYNRCKIETATGIMHWSRPPFVENRETRL
jgi:hypothetical protein